ncbi:hypothetical protein BGZ49_000106 [Haplosporangium sp. Z 27]|nr:hypothetical protein BGZ49_000106 [Haplosporangium sp. Z 27]
MTRVQTRMSAKYLSYPMARFQEEQKVKAKVKRTMIIRMIIIWIVLWFGGAGVFCAFERWTFLESLYFCYVTLTTIGFGDYVPTEPGSIEFWNVYVFVGLTIFAYILSLFSDTIASRIHLVDDNDVDEYEDDFFVRDQHNGDFSAPHGPLPALMFSKGGGVLGLNGARWSQYHREQLRLYPFHKQQQEISEESLQPSQSSNQDRPRRRGVHLWTRQRKEQLCLQRKKSSVRVLRISAKERKQMSQAEYYTNLGGHFKKSSIMVIDPEDIKNSRNILENTPYTKSDMAATTTKFVELHGVSRHRRVGSRYSMISAPGSTNSLSPGYKSNIQPGHQSYVYGAGYHDVMTGRRRSVVEVRTQDMPPLSPSSYSAHNIQYSTNGTNYRSTHDGEHGSILGSTTPHSNQSLYEHSHYGSPPQDQYLQTNALQHQPQVHFESPETISRGNTVSRRSDSQQDSPQSRQQQDDKCLEINNSSIVITSPSQMKPNQETIIGIGEEETSSLHGPPLLLPQSKGNREGSLTTLHSPWSEQENETENKRDAFTRYLNLEHTRQSHSSDATKIGSPISYNIPTDSCPGMDAFSNESGNSYLGEVIKDRVDNSPIISCKRDGIAPDEIPPYEFSNTLLTPPNSRPSQSIFNSALDQSWKSIVKDDASDLEPIWEQKTEHQ